jgi:hypothetical protein
MPRFSIKDLLIAMTLVGMGTTLMYFVATHSSDKFSDPVHKLLGWLSLVALGLVGAGFGMPFHRPWHGVAWAYVLSIVLMSLFILYSFLR